MSQMKNLRLRRLSDLPEITKLVSGRTGIWDRLCWLPISPLPHPPKLSAPLAPPGVAPAPSGALLHCGDPLCVTLQVHIYSSRVSCCLRRELETCGLIYLLASLSFSIFLINVLYFWICFIFLIFNFIFRLWRVGFFLKCSAHSFCLMSPLVWQTLKSLLSASSRTRALWHLFQNPALPSLYFPYHNMTLTTLIHLSVFPLLTLRSELLEVRSWIRLICVPRAWHSQWTQAIQWMLPWPGSR